MAKQKTNLIKVKSGRDDNQVVLTERHLDHPNGEVFLSQPDRTITVAETSQVLGLLSWGWLVKVESKSRKQSPGSSVQDTKELK